MAGGAPRGRVPAPVGGQGGRRARGRRGLGRGRSSSSRRVCAGPAAARRVAAAGEARRETLPRLEQDPETARTSPPCARTSGPTPLAGPSRCSAWIDRARRARPSSSRAARTKRPHRPRLRSRPARSSRGSTRWRGMTPPVHGPHDGPGPRKGAASRSSGYVVPLDLVAARMWADDGNPFAEVVAFTPDACDALAEAYAPGWGWILACSSPAGTRAQLLREDPTPAGWAARGPRGDRPGPVGRASVGFEPPWTWTLTQRAKAVGGDRSLTFRYGPDGQPVAGSPPSGVPFGPSARLTAGPRPTPSSSTSNTRVESRRDHRREAARAVAHVRRNGELAQPRREASLRPRGPSPG